jgi:hypothetical protein
LNKIDKHYATLVLLLFYKASYMYIFLSCFQKGEEIIKGFLERVQRMSTSGMSDQDIVCQVKTLKEQVLDENNAFIRDVIAKQV